MFKLRSLLWFAAVTASAEVHHLSLSQTVALAIEQNPEVAQARLDEQKAKLAVRVARDPFVPRVSAGSGLAYSTGFPMSIEGAAPSIVQARATGYLFNRPQSYQIAQSQEEARGATIATAAKREDVTFRTAALYQDAERSARIAEMARKQSDSLEKVLETVRGRVQEGRALPIEVTRANLNLAKARQLAASAEADRDSHEAALAVVLGFSAEDRVRPTETERAAAEIPASEDEAVEAALASNKEVRRLQSMLIAKELEARGQRANRLPKLDIVAQYGLFARYNYADYFMHFQRHNGQVGIAFQLPLLSGPGVNALASQAEVEAAHIKIDINATRNRISQDVRQGYRDLHKAETAREVAKLDLDLAREQITVNLALMQEGRLGLAQVEEARFIENEKWIAFYDAQYTVERARWVLLRQTGDLIAALR